MRRGGRPGFEIRGRRLDTPGQADYALHPGNGRRGCHGCGVYLNAARPGRSRADRPGHREVFGLIRDGLDRGDIDRLLESDLTQDVLPAAGPMVAMREFFLSPVGRRIEIAGREPLGNVRSGRDPGRGNERLVLRGCSVALTGLREGDGLRWWFPGGYAPLAIDRRPSGAEVPIPDRLRASHRSWRWQSWIRDWEGPVRPRRVRHRPAASSPPRISPSCAANLDRYIREVVPTLPDSDAFYVDRARPETLKQLQHMERRPFFRDYVQHPTWLDLARALLGEDVEAHVSRSGSTSRPVPTSPTPPHQDNYYFNLKPPNVAHDLAGARPGGRGERLPALCRAARTAAASGRTAGRNVLGFSQGITDYGPEDRAREVRDPPAAGRRRRPPRRHDPPGRAEPLRARATAGRSRW